MQTGIEIAPCDQHEGRGVDYWEAESECRSGCAGPIKRASSADAWVGGRED